jgi:dihydropteroate synthase
MLSVKCQDKLLEFDEPKVMGIINVTPDSFYGGSRVSDDAMLLSKIQRFIVEGADVIDIGAVSTRPNAKLVSQEEEMQRLERALKLIQSNFPNIILSVDTFRSEVARMATDHGAHIINDVSGGNLDSNMFSTVAELQVPYVLMHSRGDAQTMAGMTNYENVTVDVIRELSIRLAELYDKGVKDVIIDPGFGFAKTLEQNYELLAHLSQFAVLEAPLLVGVSRKSMIYKLLDNSPQEALNGTSALHMFALIAGANILRVHDVKEAAEVVRLHEKLKKC